MRKGWHPADIKAELHKRGVQFQDISRAMGHADPGTASKVLRQPYPIVERIIAQILGVPPRYIWPDRYNADGTPVARGPRRGLVEKYRKLPLVGIGKSAGAA